MQGKSQILSLKKSLLMITGHSAIKAGISLIPLPQVILNSDFSSERI